MFRKIKNIDLPYDKQALVYYTCVNYKSCGDDVRRKIRYLCNREGSLSGDLFSLVTSGGSVKNISIMNNVADKGLSRARKNFYESWFDKKEEWNMPRKTKMNFKKRAEEIMEKTLDRLEACIDDYETPIPLNQLTSALGALYDRGCHSEKDEDSSIKVKINIE